MLIECLTASNRVIFCGKKFYPTTIVVLFKFEKTAMKFLGLIAFYTQKNFSMTKNFDKQYLENGQVLRQC